MDSVMMMLLYVSNDLNGFDDDEFTGKKKNYGVFFIVHVKSM